MDIVGMISRTFEKVKEWALEIAASTLGMSPEGSAAVLIFAAVIVILAVLVIAAQARSGLKPPFVATAFMAIPIAVFAVLLSLETRRGNPDDYCDKYKGGKLLYSLVSLSMVPQEPRKPIGEQWIIFVVRSERWGTTPHMCRVDLRSRAGMFFRKKFFKDDGEPLLESVGGDGIITFTFGGKNEEPNVTFRPTEPPEKKIAPPERKR